MTENVADRRMHLERLVMGNHASCFWANQSWLCICRRSGCRESCVTRCHLLPSTSSCSTLYQHILIESLLARRKNHEYVEPSGGWGIFLFDGAAMYLLRRQCQTSVGPIMERVAGGGMGEKSERGFTSAAR